MQSQAAKTARFRHASRQRGGVAARGARTGDCKDQVVSAARNSPGHRDSVGPVGRRFCPKVALEENLPILTKQYLDREQTPGVTAKH
jgi:hypothetical protein